MKKTIPYLLLASLLARAVLATAGTFTPLLPIPSPKILNLPAGTPGGNFSMTNLFDSIAKTEFASTDLGTNTVVELDLRKPTLIAALRHVDRNDAATVAESRLDINDANGTTIRSIKITHANKRSGETSLILPEPVTGSRLRWQVTRLGNSSLLSVGGAELAFFTSAPAESAPLRDQVAGRVLPFLENDNQQTVKLTVAHTYAEPATATVTLGNEKRDIQMKWGANEVDWKVPAAWSGEALTVSLSYASRRALPVNSRYIYYLTLTPISGTRSFNRQSKRSR
jgi:hypothetical protein